MSRHRHKFRPVANPSWWLPVRFVCSECGAVRTQLALPGVK